MNINRLNSATRDFDTKLKNLLSRDTPRDREIERTVANIIARLKREGDSALIKLTNEFDARKVTSADQLEIPKSEINAAVNSLSKEIIAALKFAAQRIADHHRRELLTPFKYSQADGSEFAQRITPLARVGVYVPGGNAAYPSSALMGIIPAKVAGVEEIIMAVPTPGGEINPAVLAAADIAGVDKIFTIGGAQAIAALAYGTKTVPAVDKIVGPGNAYVAAAKRQVFGAVGIDSIAGPTEVVIICDRNADCKWVAMDMLAQAEHDMRAQAIAICEDANTLDAIGRELESQLPKLPRAKIIKSALVDFGALIKVKDLNESVNIANRIAPEHLEIMTEDAVAVAERVKNAGAIFIGKYSGEALGDYCAGPNHVLPTAGTARFASPLGVADFQKRSSIINMQARGAAELSGVAATLARCEGLEAHARAAEYRGNKINPK